MSENENPKIGIVCATSREGLLIVNPHQFGLRQIEKDPFRIYVGPDLAVIMTGMRKECATLGIRELLNRFESIEDVINIGVAGSLNKADYPMGSVVLAESVQQHDDESEDIIRLDQSLDMLLTQSRLKTARVLTGDAYVSLKMGGPALARLRQIGDVVEMEAYSTVKECVRRGITPHVIKAISDDVYNENPEQHLIDFPRNANTAARKAHPILREVIEIIKNPD